MNNYIIYTHTISENGNRVRIYAVQGDYYEGFMMKEDSERYGDPIATFPTINSAIIWWAKSLKHFRNPVEPYINIKEDSSNPINIAQYFKDIDYITPVHRLSLLRNTTLNCPDENTMTSNEKKEYESFCNLLDIKDEAAHRIFEDEDYYEMVQKLDREVPPYEPKKNNR